MHFFSLNNPTFQYFSQIATYLGLLYQKTELYLDLNCRLWIFFSEFSAIRIACQSESQNAFRSPNTFNPREQKNDNLYIKDFQSKTYHCQGIYIKHFDFRTTNGKIHQRKPKCFSFSLISLNNLTFQYFSQNTTHLGLLNQKTELNLEQNCRLGNFFKSSKNWLRQRQPIVFT